MKITHLTTVHPRYDSRIFLKQCCSLAESGHEVRLVVADGFGNEQKNLVLVEDIGASSGRMNRMITKVREMYAYALSLDSDIYHLHDPELLTIALRLKSVGKTVVFDAHEDLPKQILGKPYLNKPVKILLSKVLKWYEKQVCSQIDGVVAATPYIRDKFLNINPRTVDVNNYPILDELVSARCNQRLEERCVSYIGGLSRHRGIVELLQALEQSSSGITLKLAGKVTDAALEPELTSSCGAENIQSLGWLDREGVRALLNESLAGMVTLHPLVNYLDSLPIKMFEYMSAGVPVIASDFPLWKTIIEDDYCGLCVDPLDPVKIAEAIDYLVEHPEKAREMGKNGRRLVKEKYNWEAEFNKLGGFYAALKREQL